MYTPWHFVRRCSTPVTENQCTCRRGPYHVDKRRAAPITVAEDGRATVWCTWSLDEFAPQQREGRCLDLRAKAETATVRTKTAMD